MKNPDDSPRVRLDKWLWAARFFKTRALSAAAIDKGQVRINGQVAKASREPHLGDTIEFRQGHDWRAVMVRGLSAVRGSAPLAQQLYEETGESVARRMALAEQRRLAPEPALSQATGRPTKRDRRTLKDWGDRWSAALDDD